MNDYRKYNKRTDRPSHYSRESRLEAERQARASAASIYDEAVRQKSNQPNNRSYNANRNSGASRNPDRRYAAGQSNAPKPRQRNANNDEALRSSASRNIKQRQFDTVDAAERPNRPSARSNDRISRKDYDRDSASYRRNRPSSPEAETTEQLQREQGERPNVNRANQPRARAVERPPRDKRQVDPTVEPAAENGFGVPSKRNYLGKLHEFTIAAFGGILTFGLVLGLLFFMRPSVSQAENRQLTEFPQFSIQSFLDGDFTEGVSTWYADTYPFRDKLIAINQRFKTLYGFESDTQMYGTTAEGDAIPTETGVEATPKKDPVAPETYDSWNLEEDIQGQIMQGLYVKDGSVYATYGFTQEAANDYVNAVNSAADKLDGTTNVYSILIPNNSGVLLDETELAALGGSNQGQAIQYYYDSYNDKVKTVETMDTLIKHKDEYLYFRTDHHWTALAAYYVYQNFCDVKGFEAHSIDQFQEKDFAPFLGSYYTQLQLDSLTADPDTVQAWIPMGTNDMVYTDITTGEEVQWNVIRDVSDWDQGTLYNCFVAGDEPWAEIHNPAITDGSSCVVVKESYGNAFIPWLVDHYETVYIADFRYTNVNVADFCKENNVNDLILLNNISIIGSVDVAGKIASIL